MSNKSDKRKDEELRRQQEANNARFSQFLTTAATKSPLEQAWENAQLAWLNATDGSTPLDVEKLPGMGIGLGQYSARRARARQDNQRMGTGAIQLGLSGNQGLTDALSQQSRDKADQEAALGLEEYVAQKDAMMRGQVLPTLGHQQNRTMGLASLTGNAAQNSTGLWAQFRPRPSWLAQAGLAAIGGGSQAAAAYLGRPPTGG